MIEIKFIDNLRCQCGKKITLVQKQMIEELFKASKIVMPFHYTVMTNVKSSDRTPKDDREKVMFT